MSARGVDALIARPRADDLAPGLRAPNEEERQLLARAAQDASRIRRLSFKRPVTCVIATRAGAAEQLRSGMKLDRIARSQLIYRALGMLPPTFELAAELPDMLAEHFSGSYDIERHMMTISEQTIGIADVERELARGERARGSLRHEFAHALQDQHYGLAAMNAAAISEDQREALAALVEGEASLVGLGDPRRQGGGLHRVSRAREVIDAVAGGCWRQAYQGDALGSMPRLLGVGLAFRYGAGFGFAARLHGRDGWASIAQAWRQLPQSTAQIIHPERYTRREAPQAVSIPSYPQLEARGFTALEPGSLGEVDAAIYFMTGLPEERAWEAADGWLGDTVQPYRGPNGEGAAIWALLWKDATEARQAAEAARAAVAVRPPEDRVRAAVVAFDRWVIIGHGLPTDLVAGFSRMTAPPRQQ